MQNDVIKLLPDSVANQIAAGEVIQEPASVVKELVENSIDAGADNIQIVLKDAGKTLIQVVDNGCGMSATDARLAFERHATSKIRKADDLFALHTMGFRGEALPSIAAVSEVEMRTQRADDTIGTRLIIKGSKVESQKPDVCTCGTNIMVKHLFFNFVARRRYLKKDSQELSQIMHEFERLALVNTEVQFSLTSNGTLLHQLPCAPLKQRIGALFGKSVEKQIIPIETSTSVVKISGYIGLPEAARKRGALQYFFVNGRNMRHRYFHRAVINCYKDLISADVQPNYFINFDLPPERIDVNVHPQKHEIKFEDEQLVWQILSAAIKEALGKFNVAPAIDFNAVDVPDIPPFDSNAANAPNAPVSDDFDPTYSPFEDSIPIESQHGFKMSQPGEIPAQSKMFNDFHAGTLSQKSSAIGNWSGAGVTSRQSGSLHSVNSSINRNWDKLYEAFTSQKEPQSPDDGSTLFADVDNESDTMQTLQQVADAHGFTTSMIQFKNRYIVTDSKSGLMIVDCYRAHICVLYDTLLPHIAAGNVGSQLLLIPETFELDATTAALLSDNITMLQGLGFKAEHGNSYDSATQWQLTAAPSGVQPSQAVDTLKNIINDIAECTADSNGTGRSWHQRAALSMARASAIRSNRPLTDNEMERLLTDLFRLPAPGYTPDGLPVIRILPTDQITTLFNK